MKKKRYGDYHKWVNGQTCIISHCPLPGVGHHVKTVGAGGEDWANEVPLCGIHHNEVHTIGRKTFEAKYRINLSAKAEELSYKYINPSSADLYY